MPLCSTSPRQKILQLGFKPSKMVLLSFRLQLLIHNAAMALKDQNYSVLQIYFSPYYIIGVNFFSHIPTSPAKILKERNNFHFISPVPGSAPGVKQMFNNCSLNWLNSDESSFLFLPLVDEWTYRPVLCLGVCLASVGRKVRR